MYLDLKMLRYLYWKTKNIFLAVSSDALHELICV